MRAGLAFFAGVIGGAVMTALLIGARIADMTEMNLAMTLGSMLTRQVSATTWTVGFLMHLAISGLVALIYAAAFEAIRRSTWWLGLLGGAIHAAVAGLVMLLMPAIHPLIPDVIVAPGAFGIQYGAVTAVVFVLLHLIYGVIVGGAYETLHTRAPSGRRQPQPVEHPVGSGTKRP